MDAEKNKKNEVTFYKFLSNINSFLSKLKKSPISAEPSKFLKDNDFDKKRLIHILIKRGIISRKEKIKDPTNSDEKVAKYYVKYTIIRDGYENKIRKLYNDYFGKKQLNECDCSVSGSSDGATGGPSCDNVMGDSRPITAFGYVRRSILPLPKKKNKKENTNETMRKRVYLTEEQIDYIKKNINEEGVAGATTTFSVGAETSREDMGYNAPGFDTSNKGFWKDSLKHQKKGGISMQRVGKDGKAED